MLPGEGKKGRLIFLAAYIKRQILQKIKIEPSPFFIRSREIDFFYLERYIVCVTKRRKNEGT
jgi:hypothetical protein